MIIGSGITCTTSQSLSHFHQAELVVKPHSSCDTSTKDVFVPAKTL